MLRRLFYILHVYGSFMLRHPRQGIVCNTLIYSSYWIMSSRDIVLCPRCT